MKPIAVCFHDPLGFFTVPEVSTAPAMPGLCRVTLEQSHITYLYADGSEEKAEGDQGYYCELVQPGLSEKWWDDRPSCPYLTALARCPWFPLARYTWENLALRWSTEALAAEGRSRHRGTVGKREEFDLEYVETFGPFESEWGVSYRHEFLDKKDKFTWWTGKQLDIIPSEVRRVKATVKKHDWHQGVPVTDLSRVSPMKGERPLTRGHDADGSHPETQGVSG